jgi:PHD/YefM family antitoxin component YafN of YafNO toxin-antitoxin module
MLPIQLAAQILIYSIAITAYNYHRIIRDALMLDTRQIHSLTDFLRNHKAHVKRLKKTKTPEVLTVNGKAEVVVQDAASYQRMQDRLHHMETLAAIQEGMASAERGELKPAAQVLDEMRTKYGLSR